MQSQILNLTKRNPEAFRTLSTTTSNGFWDSADHESIQFIVFMRIPPSFLR